MMTNHSRYRMRTLSVLIVLVVVFASVANGQVPAASWLKPAGKKSTWLTHTQELREVLPKIDTGNKRLARWMPRLESRCKVLMRFDDMEDFRRRIYAEQTTVMARDMSRGEAPFRRYAGQNIPYVYWSDFLQDLHGTKFVVPVNYDPDKEYQIFMYYKLGGSLTYHKGEKWVSYDTPGAKLGDPYKPSLELCRKTPDTFHTWSALSSQVKGRVGQHIELIEMSRAWCMDFSISPDRLFLSGFSDGGFNSLFVGSYFPHLVAGIAPGVANWQYTNVAQVGLFNVPTLVIDGWHDAGYVAENMSRFLTLGNMGYPISCLFTKEGHTHKHWSDEEIFMTMIEWARHQRRNVWPKRVRYATWNLNWHQAYWLSIERMVNPGDAALVDAKVDGNTIEVTAKNVGALRLTLSEKLLIADQSIRVVVNGKAMYSGKYQEVLDIDVTPLPGEWVKNPRRPGGITVAVDRSSYLGDVLETHVRNAPGREWRTVLPTSRVDLSPYQGFVPSSAPRSDQVDQDVIANNNLILIGTPKDNSVLAKFNDRLPIKFQSGKFIVGSRVYDQPQHTIRFICPHPLNEDKYLMVVAANDPVVARKQNWFGHGRELFSPKPLRFREGDCQVYGAESPTEQRFAVSLTRPRPEYYTFTADWQVPDEAPVGVAESFFDFASLQTLTADALREELHVDVGLVSGYPAEYTIWRGSLLKGPITENDLLATRMLPEFVTTAEVTGRQLRELLGGSVASSVLPSRNDPAYKSSQSLAVEDIQDSKVYTVASDYSALNRGRLGYRHGPAGAGGVPSPIRFASVADLLKQTDQVVLRSRNLVQTDRTVGDVLLAYARRKGKLSPRAFSNDIARFVINPHAHSYQGCEWWHVHTPIAFKKTFSQNDGGRSDTIRIGIESPQGKQGFADLNLNEGGKREWSPASHANVDVTMTADHFGLTGGFDDQGRPQGLKMLRDNPGDVGQVAVVHVNVANRSDQSVRGKLLLCFEGPVRYSSGWPHVKYGEEKESEPLGFSLAERVPLGNKARQTHGAVFLSQSESGCKHIRHDISFGLGHLGALCSLDVSPGESTTKTLLFFNACDPSKTKAVSMDVNAFLSEIRQQLQE